MWNQTNVGEHPSLCFLALGWLPNPSILEYLCRAGVTIKYNNLCGVMHGTMLCNW